MKALRIASHDPPRLEIADIPVPAPQTHEALVRIRAAGLNRADLAQLRGAYSAPADAPGDIPGLEFAGTIEALGAGCTRFSVGQAVIGLCGGGAHAQYIVSPEELLMPLPEGSSFVEGAAIPEAYVTAHDAFVTQAGLLPGEHVLVHAAGSGVGIAAAQIARAWGCDAFGTSRSHEKLAKLAELGIAHAVAPESFDDDVLERTAGRGVDVILDPVGAVYLDRNLKVLAPRGRLVIIATLGGGSASLPLAVIMRKRLRMIGTMLRTRSLSEKAQAVRSFERDMLSKVSTGELKPIVDRIFPLHEAPQAYARMEANQNFGKIVLTM